MTRNKNDGDEKKKKKEVKKKIFEKIEEISKTRDSESLNYILEYLNNYEKSDETPKQSNENGESSGSSKNQQEIVHYKPIDLDYKEVKMDEQPLFSPRQERESEAEIYKQRVSTLEILDNSVNMTPPRAIEYSVTEKNLPLTPISHNSQLSKIDEQLEKGRIEHEQLLAIAEQRRREMEIADKQNREMKDQKMLEERKKAGIEFDTKMGMMRKENEEKLNRVKKEREDYERETRRLREESFENSRKRTEELFECYQMKLKFEKEEKAVSEWLHVQREPLRRAKERCFRLEDEYKRGMESVILQDEVFCLHRSTLLAYETIFKGCQDIKQLSAQYPDKKFLRILLKSLVSVNDKLFYVLIEIDVFLKTKQLIDLVFKLFSDVKPLDILTTWQIREIERKYNCNDYQFIKDPYIYSSNFVRIEEVVEGPESSTYSVSYI